MGVSRILLVDESAVARLGLKQLLGSEPDLEICGEADNATEALNAIEASKPDLVLLDLKLHGSSGLDVLKQMRGRAPVKILVCSEYDAASYAERAVRAGASGYVSKHGAVATVLDAVRTVLSGRIHVSADIADQMLHRISKTNGNTADDPIRTLSDREIQVFSMIGEGCAVKEIATRLNLSPRTVETHRDNIKSKLGLESSSEVVRRAAQWVME